MTTIVLKKGEEEVIVEEVWSGKEIQTRVQELAAEIANRYIRGGIWKEGEKILMVPILKGARPFSRDLKREMIPCFPPRTLETESYGVSLYLDQEHPGRIHVYKDIKGPLRGSHVLVVDDIEDTGYTLQEIKRRLEAKNPKSLTLCVLIDKRPRRRASVEIAHVGFILKEDWWVIGYGMDWREEGRELSWIGRKMT